MPTLTQNATQKTNLELLKLLVEELVHMHERMSSPKVVEQVKEAVRFLMADGDMEIFSCRFATFSWLIAGCVGLSDDYSQRFAESMTKLSIALIPKAAEKGLL